MPPQLPKPPRRTLKMHPDPDAQLEELVRSLGRIADGLSSMLEWAHSITVAGDGGRDAIRTVRE